jgi:nitrogen-specific signal transduction histidine kinase
VTGVTGAVFGTLGVAGRTDGVTVLVNASASAGELRSIEVTQDDVMVAPSIASRFFDPLWAERPGGWVGGLGASAARAVAQQQGGSAVFLAGERRGTVIRLSFVPAA